MKTSLLRVGLALAAAWRSRARTGPRADAAQPHLETRHGVRQLVVDGQPS